MQYWYIDRHIILYYDRETLKNLVLAKSINGCGL